MSGHFFNDQPTPGMIADLSKPGPLTIYVGLGGTIDRTGTSWSAMIQTILEKNGVERDTARALIASTSNERSATTAEILLRDSTDDQAEFERNLRDSIRATLYSSRKHLRGRLLWNIAALAYANAYRGHSTILVTPNYDEYLYRELQRYYEEKRGLFPESFASVLQPLEVVTGSDTDASGASGTAGFSSDAPPGVAYELPRISTKKSTSPTITCIHIHGFVGEEESVGTPVVGELTYNQTRRRTTEILETLFKHRHLIVVGSSLTDGPLCEALLAATNQGAENSGPKRRRYVISPLQAPEWSDKTLRPLMDRRHEALGLETVHPHHFGQVGQFLSEVAGAMYRGDGTAQRTESHPSRYNRRLREWWGAQQPRLFENPNSPEAAYQVLKKSLDRIRTVAKFAPGEELKLELWGRYDPNHARRLRLIGTSIGPWDDVRTAHYADIAPDSQYFAARVFTMAAPMVHNEPKGHAGRWKTYVGIPIWVDRSTFQLPLGVAVLASMRPYPDEDPRLGDGVSVESAIAIPNLKTLLRAFEVMTYLGEAILKDEGTLAEAKQEILGYLKASSRATQSARRSHT
ncbi:hypothetical protein [Nocardioides sp. GCM10030258]|uniref:hypothetical protein n=1 Tax=unclassified Nocardioides TaxID=2615069 RepID=UPI0036112F69